jgi:hypothetical protein
VLAHYIANPINKNLTEKCIYLGARGFLSSNLNSQICEMTALANECVKSRDPIRHDVISFKEHDVPTAAQVDEIIDIYLKELGLEGHQIIFGLHSDSGNMHIHVAINRIHPVTTMAVKIDRGFDKEALQRVCARVEHAQGWTPEQNSRYHVNESGQMSARPIRNELARKPSARARNFEIRTGIKSAASIVIEDATPILLNVKSWHDVHNQLGGIGIEFKQAGSGAIMLVGNIAVKASLVARDVRFSALQKKLGPFEPKQLLIEHVYFEHKIENERATNKSNETEEQDVDDTWYGTQNSVRRLSKCSLAFISGPVKKRARVLQIDARACRQLSEPVRWTEGIRVDPKRINKTLNSTCSDHDSDWIAYAAARTNHYTNFRADTKLLRQRHGEADAELKEYQRNERDNVLPMLEYGATRAGLTNVLRRLLKVEQSQAKSDLKVRHLSERAELKIKYPQFVSSFEQWLCAAGKFDAAQKWRYKDNPNDEPCLVQGVASSMLNRGDGSTTICHSVDHHEGANSDSENTGFSDKGMSLVVERWSDEDTIMAALELASLRWGQFHVTGHNEYKLMCCKLAAENDFEILNPELQLEIEEQLAAVHQRRNQYEHG